MYIKTGVNIQTFLKNKKIYQRQFWIKRQAFLSLLYNKFIIIMLCFIYIYILLAFGQYGIDEIQGKVG